MVKRVVATHFGSSVRLSDCEAISNWFSRAKAVACPPNVM
jgi:hypothetical protein